MYFPGNLHNQWAVITGSSGGIGKEMSLLLAQRGMNIVLIARSEDLLLELSSHIESLGVECLVLVLDLAKLEAPRAVMEFINTHNVTPRVFIANAGCGVYGYMQDTSYTDIANMLQLNVCSLTLLTRLMTPIMTKDSYILLVSSTIAFQPSPLYAAYAASKSYVHSLGLALAWEHWPRISVSTLYPGMTATNFFNNSHQKLPPLTKRLFMMSAPTVAKIGLHGLFTHRPRIIAGLRNRILASLTKLIPDALSMRIAYLILKSR